jgi:hypothetical protein
MKPTKKEIALTKAIKKIIKDNGLDVARLKTYDDGIGIIRQLNYNGVIFFDLSQAGEDGEYEYEASYYSNKLKKNVILSLDFPCFFDDLAELVAVIIQTQKEADKLEKSIVIKTK